VSGVGVTGSAVFVSSSGQLGVRVSPVRFKNEIKPMDKASEAILALKPVTSHYRKEIDPDRTLQFGLVAEEVEKVNRDLVTPDADGKTFTVRYDAVNAMLLNEFLKEHPQVQEQQKEIDALRAELKEQRTLVQKVSARLELQKAPAQTVANGKQTRSSN
jgi:trimeric autotransporter adhesin